MTPAAGAKSNPPRGDDWKSVFAFLEQEIKFQAAAAAVTGAAAAWWLKAILTKGPGTLGSSALTQSFAGRLAATLLTFSAFLFFLDEGRLAKRYGDLARALAKSENPAEPLTATLVRNVSLPKKDAHGHWQWIEWPTVVQWSPYYLARLLLFAVAAILLSLVFGWWS